MPFTPTGHPDWIAASSTPIPVLVEQMTGLAVGTFGPTTVQVSGGGAYLLSVNAVTEAEYTAVDITVKHLDVNGTEVYRDFFGGVVAGSPGGGFVEFPGPTTCRGNIYGYELVISGQVAAGAWFNTILNVSGFTGSAADINVYVLPNNIGDPEPKVSNGSAEPVGTSFTAPGGLLIGVNGLSMAPTVTEGPFAVVPYSGPYVIIMNQTGDTTNPLEVDLNLLGYTVAGGTTPLYSKVFRNPVVTVVYDFNDNMPCCFNTWKLSNLDAVQTAIVNVTATAQKSA